GVARDFSRQRNLDQPANRSIEPQHVVRLRVDPDASTHTAFDIEAEAVFLTLNERDVDGRLLDLAIRDHDRLAAIDRVAATVSESVFLALTREQQRERLLFRGLLFGRGAVVVILLARRRSVD